jgi:hypothetical protein
MQQVAPSEPHDGQRPRRHLKTQPDRVVTVLKIATFLVGAGVIGLIILMATGWPNEVAGRVPVPPPPPASGSSGDDGKPGETRTTEPSPTMIAPPVRAETSLVAPKPAPPPPPSTPKPAPPTPPIQQPPGFTFAVIGQPCPEPGLFSLTSDYEPVACVAEPPSDQPRWQRMF